MKTSGTFDTRVPRQFFAAIATLFIFILACGNGILKPPPTPTASPTRTPLIGMAVFGVVCDPPELNILHGETPEIGLVDSLKHGKVTDFKIGSIAGGAGDADASEIDVSQEPAPNGAGWSTLPGAIQVVSSAVDGPPRTESYYINILLGGYQGADHIVGGNLWCLVNVEHIVPPTTTATPAPHPSPTPTPPFITTGDGFRIIYTGPRQAQTGGTLEAIFQIVTPDGLPAKGILAASLGDPPSDRKASHASGELDTEGKVTLFFDVNWPAGTTKLYISHAGKIYEVTEITINP